MERRVEVLRYGKWEETSIEGLDPREVFRMFEPDGSPVKWNGDGGTDFFTLSPPYQHEDGVWGIDCKEYVKGWDETWEEFCR